MVFALTPTLVLNTCVVVAMVVRTPHMSVRILCLSLPPLLTNLGLHAALLGRAVFRYRRYGHLRAGHCVRCGYNLKGLPEPRCPECGTPFDPAHPAIEDVESVPTDGFYP